MKKILYLSAATLFAVTVTAQTVSKSGHGTRSYSSGSSHSSSSSSSGHSSSKSGGNSSYSGTSTSTGSKAGSGTKGSQTSRDPYSSHTSYYVSNYTRVEPASSGKYLSSYMLTMAKVRVEKGEAAEAEVVTPAKDENAASSPGTVKSVSDETQAENYSDKKKDAVEDNEGENGSTNAPGTSSVAAQAYGADEIEAAKNFKYNPLKFHLYIYCNRIFTNRQQLLIALSGCGGQSASVCGGPYVKTSNPIITCQDFETMNDETRMHIVTHCNLYDLSLLSECETYLEYIKKIK